LKLDRFTLTYRSFSNNKTNKKDPRKKIMAETNREKLSEEFKITKLFFEGRMLL